jgi:hypothetical protein
MFDPKNPAGLDRRLLKTTELIECPRCGFKFRLMYARTFACAGCRLAVMGCDKVRCPKCDCHFPINATPLPTEGVSGTQIARYMSNLMTKYHHDFGKNPSR